MKTTKTKSKTQISNNDPLLALLGTLEWEIPDVSNITPVEIRVIEQAKNHKKQDEDPLLALLGTLESNVTDIGERHDDYIGDALLVKLWGNDNEQKRLSSV